MKKDLLAVALAVFLLVFLVRGTEIQSVEDYYLTHLDDIGPESETVTLSIRCDAVFDRWDDLDPALREGNYIPADGVYLAPTAYVLRPGDTVYDILCRVVRANRIPLACAYTAQYESVYIQGIGHLCEFDCGELSGWMYTVNGVFPGRGCSRYEPRDGDVIIFVYTCDLGRDVGCDLGVLS